MQLRLLSHGQVGLAVGTEEETQLDGLMCTSNNAFSYGDTTEQASQSNSLIAFEQNKDTLGQNPAQILPSYNISTRGNHTAAIHLHARPAPQKRQNLLNLKNAF